MRRKIEYFFTFYVRSLIGLRESTFVVSVTSLRTDEGIWPHCQALLGDVRELKYADSERALGCIYKG